MNEFRTIVMPATIRATHQHQEQIRNSTLQGFVFTLCAFMLCALLVSRIHRTEIVPVIPVGLPPITLEELKEQIKEIVQPVSHALNDGSRFQARPDTVPQVVTIQNILQQSLNSAAAGFSGVVSNQTTTGVNGGLNGGTQNGSVAAKVQVNDDERFENIPEVDAEVNFRALESHLEYPEFMKRAGATGTVVVVVSIDEFGHAVKARVENSSDEGFNAAALKAVLATSYKAARNAGQPVPSTLAIPIRFRLN